MAAPFVRPFVARPNSWASKPRIRARRMKGRTAQGDQVGICHSGRARREASRGHGMVRSEVERFNLSSRTSRNARTLFTVPAVALASSARALAALSLCLMMRKASMMLRDVQLNEIDDTGGRDGLAGKEQDDGNALRFSQPCSSYATRDLKSCFCDSFCPRPLSLSSLATARPEASPYPLAQRQRSAMFSLMLSRNRRQACRPTRLPRDAWKQQ